MKIIWGRKAPSFYHIHNGESQTLNSRNQPVKEPEKINANHDFPPKILLEEYFAKNKILVTRNGDIFAYVTIFDGIGKSLDQLRQEEGGQIAPNSRNLKERAEWLRLQIGTMSELYKLRNKRLPTIGGKIDVLIITPDAIDDSDLTS